MKPLHIVLAVTLTVFWGLNFVLIRIGLDHYPPILFAVLRFLVAGLPVLLVKPPKVPFPQLIAISLALFVGQFGFLFPGMTAGYPPGLASLTLQVQGFFTVILATMVLGERPKPRNIIGLIIAFAGLALIATTVGSNGVTLTGLALILAAALSWATGNVLLRGAGKVDMFALTAWISAIAVLPLAILSLVFEGINADWAAIAAPTWAGIGAIAYVSIPTTVIGYWIWAELFKHYPAAMVAPFSLLTPITGALSAWLLLGERFGSLRLGGMALILAGLVVNTVPWGECSGRREKAQ